LNRVVEWTGEGIRYEADQRHADLIIKDMGLTESANSVVTPGGKKDPESEGRRLSKEQARFRAAVARANYIVQDRSDVQFPGEGAVQEDVRPL
jgi:hypothetical protein